MTSTNCSNPTIVRLFLQQPRNRRAFDLFFDFTFRRSLAYLRYLKSIGFILPVDGRTDRDPLRDLTIDLLGPILESAPGHPFQRIFDFFASQNIGDFEGQPPQDIEEMYLRFLRRQLRQECARLKKQIDPQTENLKRRIKDIVKQSPFVLSHESPLRVDLEDDADPARVGCPEVAAAELKRIVNDAHLSSQSRLEWCRQILTEVRRLPSCRQDVSLHRLIAEMVRTNAEYVDSTTCFVAPLPGPAEGPLRAIAEEAIRQAVAQTRSEVLNEFVAKGRLKQSEVDCLTESCRLYMNDFSHNGHDTESIPTFFRATMPPETHQRYLADYKYILDTAVARCLNIFIEIMKKNPMVRAYGFYDTDE